MKDFAQTRIRITCEVDIPSNTNRREFDEVVLRILKAEFDEGYTLVYASTKVVEENILRRRPLL